MIKGLFFFFFISYGLCAFESFPPHFNESTPIFFTLHGCKQNEHSFLKDSYLIEKASSKVIFFSPAQLASSNSDYCWNWFLPSNQIPGPLSEVTYLIEELKQFQSRNLIKKNPVYVIGMSAGAAQAVNMLACYPQVFTGAALSAGLPYRVSDNIFDIEEVIAQGPRKSTSKLIKDFANCSHSVFPSKIKKLLFFHGTEDRRVHIKNFFAFESQLTGAIDYRDDGKLNHSVPYQLDRFNFYPPGKYPFELKVYKYSDSLQIKFYTVVGMKHDWSGGVLRVERNDPLGPDATGILLEHFSQHNSY